MLGAIEAGGTKFVCAAGNGPDDLAAIRVLTTSPDATIAEVIRHFKRHPVEAVGIGSFGPIDRGRGRITSTPKPGWQNYDIVSRIRAALGVPAGFDTDVNAAALAEARWGAGRGLTDFVYITVGTGIGGGAVVNGAILHGAAHAEMGHMRIPHDRGRDPFPGSCPYHGDCLEGLASGPAVAARWGAAGESVAADHRAWDLEGHYLALAVANLACTLAPQRIIFGGGVMRQLRLLALIRDEVPELLNGYVRVPELVPAQLGDQAGVLGALILAEQARSPFTGSSDSSG
ncbi:MAG TPA: ROK family protein [Bryobacteraceae bacterium]|nr:ROK family protein [Bryobacteraceae bacterium]